VADLNEPASVALNRYARSAMHPKRGKVLPTKHAEGPAFAKASAWQARMGGDPICF